MNRDFNRQLLNRFAPQEAPEVVELKRRLRTEREVKAWNEFFDKIEGKK